MFLCKKHEKHLIHSSATNEISDNREPLTLLFVTTPFNFKDLLGDIFMIVLAMR